MATTGFVSQTGGPFTWIVSGGGITNHEVWTFTLEVANTNVGALVSNATVYLVVDGIGEPAYTVTLTAVDQFGNPTNQNIFGQFESTGI
jgi:hypothetical protein